MEAGRRFMEGESQPATAATDYRADAMPTL
jgi:hypothetical protein